MANYSQQQNTTLSFALSPLSESIAWLTVFGIEAVAIVTLNALAIIMYLKECSLRKRSTYLVINQAVADMFVGGSVIICCWFYGSFLNMWPINSSIAVPVLFFVLYFFFPLASLLNLAAISLERTHATFRPFKHRLVKKKTFGAVIAAIWTTAGLFTTGLLLSPLSQLSFSEMISNIFMSHFSSFLFCLLIILVSYSSIAIKVFCGNQPHHHDATNRERKLTKTLFIVTVVSLLLTLPYASLGIFESVLIRKDENFSLALIHNSWLFLSCLFFFFANSFVNPVIYTFRMPEFKRALFSFLGCRSQPQPAQVFPLNEM